MTERERFVMERAIRLLARPGVPGFQNDELIYRVTTARIMLEELLIADSKKNEAKRDEPHH